MSRTSIFLYDSTGMESRDFSCQLPFYVSGLFDRNCWDNSLCSCGSEYSGSFHAITERAKQKQRFWVTKT